MKRLIFAEPAARDLEKIVDYIALDNPAAAEGVYRGIVGAAEKLPEFPAMGRPGRHPQTRELIVAGLLYLIVYEVDAEAVTIWQCSICPATWRARCTTGCRRRRRTRRRRSRWDASAGIFERGGVRPHRSHAAA